MKRGVPVSQQGENAEGEEGCDYKECIFAFIDLDGIGPENDAFSLALMPNVTQSLCRVAGCKLNENYAAIGC